MSPAVFFDRDGIINERRPGEYVTAWNQFRLLPDAPAALAEARARGYRIFLATNQRGVALGRMTRAELDAIHERMQAELRARGGTAFDGIAVCPHADEDACRCRKPKPGLLLDLAAEFDVDLPASWMIGDAERDVEAGRRAGCRAILVGASAPTVATHCCDTLGGAVALLPEIGR